MTKLQSWFYKYNAWSFTKHRLWGQCKRAYYYRYVGTALRRSTDFSIESLKQLKDLDSTLFLQGKLVHEVLESQIGQLHITGNFSEEAASAQYVQQVEHYRRNAKKLLVEYYNGQTVSERFFDRIREDGLDQLSMFFGVIWPQLADSEYLRHEKFDRFKVSARVQAIVKIDYVSRTQNGQVVISDWKTGVDNPEYENDLQIGAYVLWATQYYDLQPQQVKSELIYLTTGRVHPHQFSLEDLTKIGKSIVSDFEEMNKSYEIDYFDPHPDARNCPNCRFATVCPHSMTDE